MIRRPPRSTLFPYTRSSDLHLPHCSHGLSSPAAAENHEVICIVDDAGLESVLVSQRLPAQRSEEHTSELQSQSNLVCRLLLDKKKKLLQLLSVFCRSILSTL